MSSYPKRADRFREWSKMMLEQAIVPERLEYKRASSRSSTTSKSVKRMNKRWRKRRKRFLRRNRAKQE